MTASNSDGRTGVSSSQRPTMEMQEDDTLEIETLPPRGEPSVPPVSVSHRATVPGPILELESGTAGDPSMPIELEGRLLLGVLQALVPLHTNLRVSPRERAYTRVCYQNAIVEPDGSVRLRAIDEAAALPKDLVAPEVSRGGVADQQADLFAVGALLLGLVERHLANGGEHALLTRLRLLASRALRPDPAARWSSAAEFAAELEGVMGAALPSADALAIFARDQQARLEALTRAEVAAMLHAPALPRAERTGDEEPVDRQAMSGPIDLDREGGVEFVDEGTLATSGLPRPSPPPRSRRNKLLLLLCVGSVLSVGTVFAMWTRQRVDTSLALTSEHPAAPAAPSPADADPIVDALTVGGETATSLPISASRPAPASRPLVSASFAPIPLASTAKTKGTAKKPNPSRRRTSTYDPEGI